jgi:hypothetical protein
MTKPTSSTKKNKKTNPAQIPGTKPKGKTTVVARPRAALSASPSGPNFVVYSGDFFATSRIADLALDQETKRYVITGEDYRVEGTFRQATCPTGRVHFEVLNAYSARVTPAGSTGVAPRLKENIYAYQNRLRRKGATLGVSQIDGPDEGCIWVIAVSKQPLQIIDAYSPRNVHYTRLGNCCIDTRLWETITEEADQMRIFLSPREMYINSWTTLDKGNVLHHAEGGSLGASIAAAVLEVAVPPGVVLSGTPFAPNSSMETAPLLVSKKQRYLDHPARGDQKLYHLESVLGTTRFLLAPVVGTVTGKSIRDDEVRHDLKMAIECM